MRHLAAGLAVGLLALTATPALAADDSTYAGRCSFDTVNDTTPGGQLGGQDTWTGAMYAFVAVFSHTHGNVVNATVTCEIRVNGETRASASGSGSGVVALATPLTFHADITDVVGLCTVVDYTSDSTPTSVDCQYATTLQLPPQYMLDLLDYVLGVATSLEPAYVDPTVCAGFQALAPGSGPVSITPEGDVYIGGNAPEDKFWDCPPYDYPVSPPPEFPPLPPFDPHTPVQGPTGGGYDTGDIGFLALLSPETTTVTVPSGEPAEVHDVASACAFVVDRTTGTITVTGTTAAGRQPVADSASVHCRLEDADTGAVLYDHTETANAPLVSLKDTIPAGAGPVTVCTEGSSTWGTHVETVGPYCRPGKAI